MAPSHSEFWVNLASLPHWLLLGLAAGGVARELGAGRHWPLAAFPMLLPPTVVRFAAAQYVDIFLGSVLLRRPSSPCAGCASARWGMLCSPARPGLAAGAKVLGSPMRVALAGAGRAARPGHGGGALPQLAAALALSRRCSAASSTSATSRWGGGPLALACEHTASGPVNAQTPTMPRKNSVIDLGRR